ncbi:hypothetical protein [Streptomyces sp. NPDC001275]
MAVMIKVAPVSGIRLHQECNGNVDPAVHRVVYDRQRCGCSCHPLRVRRVNWEGTLKRR